MLSNNDSKMMIRLSAIRGQKQPDNLVEILKVKAKLGAYL